MPDNTGYLYIIKTRCWQQIVNSRTLSTHETLSYITAIILRNPLVWYVICQSRIFQSFKFQTD